MYVIAAAGKRVQMHQSCKHKHLYFKMELKFVLRDREREIDESQQRRKS
uniref:Uncharacterized protein n=1 Tax=Anguilla anguilla TaxID=7936 RepID=A0A0E9QFH2_ANGAN